MRKCFPSPHVNERAMTLVASSLRKGDEFPANPAPNPATLTWKTCVLWRTSLPQNPSGRGLFDRKETALCTYFGQHQKNCLSNQKEHLLNYNIVYHTENNSNNNILTFYIIYRR